jgi:hypothetical protein
VRRQLDPATVSVLQRRVWIAQRVAWGLMAVAVLAGLLGLLGSGPLAWGSVATSDGAVRVSYERFLRRGTRTSLWIRLRPNPGSATVALRIAQPYLDGMKVEGVFPTPRRVQAAPDHVTLDFDVDSRQPGPLTVAIHVVPERMGGRRGGVGVDVDAGPDPESRGWVWFRQWIYP